MAEACGTVPADSRFFEVHCRGVVFNQTELHPECFPQVPRTCILYGERRFDATEDGFQETLEFYWSSCGRPYVNLFKEVESQLDLVSTEDGANFSALRATFWAHTDEAKLPCKEVLDRPGEFHATYRDEDLIIRNSQFAQQDLMEGFDWQFGYVCGFVTLDYEWVALKRIILRIEQLLRFAMCRLQCRGHHCANVMQAVVYCFIGAPEFPRKQGKERSECNALCVGKFIKKHRDALPLCFCMWEHGCFLYMRNPGGTKKPPPYKGHVSSDCEEVACCNSCAWTQQQNQCPSRISEGQYQSRLPGINTRERLRNEIVVTREDLHQTRAERATVSQRITNAINHCDIDAYLSLKLELQSVWDRQERLEVEVFNMIRCLRDIE